MMQNQEELIRSFVAVNLPQELQERLIAIASRFKNLLKDARTRITWVKKESLHLTLKFLGSVEPDRIPDILLKLEESVLGIRPFSVVLGDLGVFPNVNQPRVIWVGVVKGGEELGTLQKRVEENLAHLGFDIEKREFSPHLTLGRIKTLGSRGDVLRALKELKTPEIGGTEVTSVHLMKSTLTPEGAIYKELGAIQLKNG